MKRLALTVTFILTILSATHAQQYQPDAPAAWEDLPTSDPVILHAGWTSPDTIYLRRNIAELEKRPFTGMVTWISWPREEHGRLWIKGGVNNPPDRKLVYDVGRRVLTGRGGEIKRLPAAAIEGAIDDLQSTTFRKLKHNYIQTYFIAASGLKPDFWYDAALWAVACENFADLARVAKLGGCEGLFIDNEVNPPHQFWSYEDLKADAPEFYAGKTWDQARAVARSLRPSIENIPTSRFFSCVPIQT